MKKAILLILLFSAAHLVTAQRGFDIKEILQRQKETLYKKVENLSPLQKELINGILDEYGVTMMETFQEARSTGNFAGLREKMEGLGEERNLLIKDVLNDKQYAVYLAVVEEGRPKPQSSDN